MFSPCSAKRRASDKDLPVLDKMTGKQDFVTSMNKIKKCKFEMVGPVFCSDSNAVHSRTVRMGSHKVNLF